jgi:[ribosomal protein S5]-alanine N-acetyltransferase
MNYMGGVRTEDQSRRWLRDNLRHWHVHGFGLWTFRDVIGGSFVGRCGLRRVELETGGEVELGYALMSRYWRKGLATEMAQAVLQVAVAQKRPGDVIALIHPRNARPRRVAERAGFQFERNIIWKSGPVMLYRKRS